MITRQITGTALLLPLLFLIAVVAMTLSAPLVPDIYSSSFFEEYTLIDAARKPDLSFIHPLYSPHFFKLIGLTLPGNLLFTPWFVAGASFACNGLLALSLAIVLRALRQSWASALALAPAILWIGPYAIDRLIRLLHLGAHRLTLPSPNPFLLAHYYDFRFLAVIAFLLATAAVLRAQYLLAGVGLGITIWLHFKFGVRGMGLVLGSALIWQWAGWRLARLPRNPVPWLGLLAMAAAAVVVALPCVVQVFGTMTYLNQIAGPRTHELISAVGWMVKNEPDDWLLTYLPTANTTALLVCGLLAAILAEWLRRHALAARQRTAAVILHTVLLLAALALGAGYVFECYAWPLLPDSLAHRLLMLRPWDYLYLFPLALLLASALTALEFCRQARSAPLRWVSTAAGETALLLLVVLATVVLAARLRMPGAHLAAVDDGPATWHARYWVVRDPTLCARQAAVAARFWQALGQHDAAACQQATDDLVAVYRDAGLPPATVQAAQDNAAGLWQLQQHHYVTALQLLQRVDTGDQASNQTVWQAAADPATGAHSELAEVMLRDADYRVVCQWINTHLPANCGVIQPPYMVAFNMYAQRLGFWDGKVDGHPMYMLPAYYTYSLARLQAVAGTAAILANPGVTCGDVGAAGRAFWLSLRMPDIAAIRAHYPEYHYVLTERANALGDLPPLFATDTFAVYAITP